MTYQELDKILMTPTKLPEPTMSNQIKNDEIQIIEKEQDKVIEKNLLDITTIHNENDLNNSENLQPNVENSINTVIFILLEKYGFYYLVDSFFKKNETKNISEIDNILDTIIKIDGYTNIIYRILQCKKKRDELGLKESTEYVFHQNNSHYIKNKPKINKNKNKHKYKLRKTNYRYN